METEENKNVKVRINKTKVCGTIFDCKSPLKDDFIYKVTIYDQVLMMSQKWTGKELTVI
jgi:hypothetical protein